MTVTLPLTADQERRIEESAARHDTEAVRQVLYQAADAVVPDLMQRPAKQLDPVEFRAVLDELASAATDSPPLSAHALSRAGIYGDHP